jgi:hypothetical protein
VDNNGEETDGVHGAGPGAEALHGHDQDRRALTRVCLLGRPDAAVLEPCGPAPHRPASSGLRVAAPRALQALPLRGLHVATSPRERAVPLAGAAARPVPNCRGHPSLAHSPRRPQAGPFLDEGQQRGDVVGGVVDVALAHGVAEVGET